MLSIASVTAHHAAHYYSSDNICIDNDAQPNSQWEGQAAKDLQLSGPVDADTFNTLLRGQTPDQKPLQQAFKIRHAAGTDLTFSAPKSGSPKQVRMHCNGE